VLQLLFRWDEALRSLRRATELDPQYATAHQWLGEALVLTGHPMDAIVESKRAVELDPVSPVMRASHAFNLSVAGDDAAAMAAIAQARVLDSTFVLAPYFGAWIHAGAGRRAEALREIRLAEPMMESFPILYGMLGYCMAVNGETVQTQALLRKLEERAAHTPGYFSSVGMIALGLGDRAKALDWLGRSARSHESFFGSTSLAALPFDPLRTDPKFTELLSLLNLPPAIATAPRPGYHR
jgi:Flp pilus assembly protein TadD